MNILKEIIEFKHSEIKERARIIPLERIQGSQRLYAVRDFIGALKSDGIQIIAERIEDEASLLELLDLELNLGQGFVFAKPERLNVTQGNLRAA